MNPGAAVRVLIVDDSRIVRRVLSTALEAQAGIEVVGAAADALEARELIRQLNPDVITLDVEMPGMDGLTFLRNLMRLRPMPVVMVSSLTGHGADATLEALEIGAVDCVPKPKLDGATSLGNYAAELAARIRNASQARVRPWTAPRAPPEVPAASVRSASGIAAPSAASRVIAIGASTGGIEAIRQLLVGLPADSPGIVIAQHIPGAFSEAFARRLNACCRIHVSEAIDGQPLLQGHACIAPGGRHLTLARDAGRYVCRLEDGPTVNRHKPSVDVLFRSVAKAAGCHAIGALLTGMGKDGAIGLREMRRAGGVTLAQDEPSSVVWGMPGEAVALDAAGEVLALEAIAARLAELRDA